MSADNSPIAFFMLLAAVSLGAAFSGHVANHSRQRVWASGLIGLGFLFLAATWDRISQAVGVQLSTSVAAVSSNAWVWLAFFVAAWGFHAWTIFKVTSQRDRLYGELRDVLQPIELTLRKLVLPRRLSKQQIDAVAGFLASRPSMGVTMSYSRRDDEAEGFMSDLREALEQGGWRIAGFDRRDDLDRGLHTDFRASAETARRRDENDPRFTAPHDILRQALQPGDVRVHGTSGGSSADIDKLILQIGPRLMGRNAP